MSAPSFPEEESLSAVSARIGTNPLLVQGPGGNTSCKSGDTLWIKASGFWLADAATQPIFMALPLERTRRLAERDAGGTIPDADAPDSGSVRRPSIETAMHALMPHPAVIHAHAVNSMTISVLETGPARVQAALAGLDWAWIPYCRPGAPLARSISAILSRQHADVLILQNHGVVVGADTPELAESLLTEVESRLELPKRAEPRADRTRLEAIATDDFEPLHSCSALALDSGLFQTVSTTALFPDQVVFLGGAVPALGSGETVAETARRIAASSGVSPALILARGIGALGARDRTPAASALIAGLYEVARRLPPGEKARGLSEDAIDELLHWDAEAHRVALSRQKRN